MKALLLHTLQPKCGTSAHFIMWKPTSSIALIHSFALLHLLELQRSFCCQTQHSWRKTKRTCSFLLSFVGHPFKLPLTNISSPFFLLWQIAAETRVRDELRIKMKQLVYFKAAYNFIQQISDAMPVLCQLLSSKTSTDVTQAIDFFVKAKEFRLQSAQVRSIHDAVAFSSLFLSFIFPFFFAI